MRRRWFPLVSESWRVCVVTKIVSGLVAILSAALPFALLGVSGMNIESRRAILESVDSAGARIITVLSLAEPSIPDSAIARIVSIEGVDWVVGLGPVSDVSLTLPAGSPTPFRRLVQAGAPIEFDSFEDRRGVFVSQKSAQRLGVSGPYGRVGPIGLDIVGWFHAHGAIASLNPFALLPEAPTGESLDRLIVATSEVAYTEAVAGAIRPLLGVNPTAEVSVQTSDILLAAHETVESEVARRDRQLVLAALVTAMILAAIVVFAGTANASRDFGRRRALGATRSQLTVLVLLATFWPALAGVLVGTLAGMITLATRLGHIPSWRFPTAIGILTLVTLTIAAGLPAVVASRRDPLRVLRVP